MPRATPQCEGYLSKQSAWLHSWRQRYFRLIDSKLYFSKGPKDEPHGVIDLSHCLTVKSAEEKTHKPHALEVATPEQTFYMAAPSEAEKNLWIGSIGQAIVKGSASFSKNAAAAAAAAAADDDDFDDDDEG